MTTDLQSNQENTALISSVEKLLASSIVREKFLRPTRLLFDAMIEQATPQFERWQSYQWHMHHGSTVEQQHGLCLFLWRDPTAEIKSAATTDAVVMVLRRLELGEVADRIAELSRLREIDPDEPELNVDSLKEMAIAVIDNPRLRAPRLTVSEQGFVHAEWRTVEGGAVAMTFLPTGRVEFGAISAPALEGKEILRLGGLHIRDVALSAVQWYAEQIETK